MKKMLHWISVIAWMGAIFYFSSQPDLESGLEMQWDFIFRKIAHISEYFVLTYLLFRAWRVQGFSARPSKFLSFAVAVAYAGFDEYHQTFVLLRHGSLIDVGIDALGVFIGLYLISAMQQHELTSL